MMSYDKLFIEKAITIADITAYYSKMNMTEVFLSNVAILNL